MEEINLEEISVSELLKRFGEGKAVPGSGSAAALQALINAKLILTVTKITLEPKRKEKYGKEWSTMLKLKEKIENQTIPKLIELFHEDYKAFDGVILNRTSRDNYRNSMEDGSAEKFLESTFKVERDLFLATKIAMEIAKEAHQLVIDGMYVFQKGYKAVRGDSGMATKGSLAVMSGAIHIAELNLKGLIDHEQFEKLELDLDKVRFDYSKANSEATKSLMSLQKDLEKVKTSRQQINQILNNTSISGIEKTVRSFQTELYNKSTEKDFDSVVNLEKAFSFLGYEIKRDPSLGTFDELGGEVETAGTVDNIKKVVRISTKYRPSIQRFTLAHELGHAILHHKTMATLHRDKALEFRIEDKKRIPIEAQADKFAAFFLMPKLEMKKQFMTRFYLDNLKIEENVAFQILGKSLGELKKKHKKKRELSRLFASTTFFAGNSFVSLSEHFKVSVEAMAIRIEELELIDFKSIGY